MAVKLRLDVLILE